MNTTEKLYEAIAAGLSIPAGEVNETLEYQGIAEWDSLSHLNLIAEIEKAFGISIATGDILEMTSVAEMKQVLKKYNVGFETE